MKNYPIAKRMASMKPSLVREILKSAADPAVIPFSAGNPAPNAFPVEAIARIVGEIMTTMPVTALQYSVTEGYEPLRFAVRELCAKRYGFTIGTAEDLIIISGAQQGADLIAKTLVNEGDTVLCEDPSFIGCLNCFRSYNCNLVGVEMEEDGLNLQKLEDAMRTQPNVKLLYVIPNFQNPTGITTSMDKRKGILELAKKYGVMILEDNPYGDLRFGGESLPPIKSMDTEGDVLYLGSFSKIMAPGLRVGFVVAPHPVLAKMTVGKQCTDVHTAMLPQLICERFLAEEDLDAHLTRLQAIYRDKCKLMLDSVAAHFDSRVRCTRPDGGLFVWCTLPAGADMMDFCSKALEQKVAVVPGIAFLANDQSPCQSFRMNFSTPSDEAIVVGVRRLGALTKTAL